MTYPDLETILQVNPTEYVELTQITNLSTPSATVYGYTEDLATFDITPINASEPASQISIEA